jgi:hypothetical protein
MSKILQMLQGMAGDAVKNAQDDDILGINQQSQSVNPMLGMIDVNGNAIATPAVENEVSPSEDLAINPELAEKFGMSEKDVYQGGQALKTAQTLDVIRQKPQEQRNEEEQTLFKTITQKAGEFFGNEENMLNMALAFNTLRFQPDQQLSAGIQNRLQTIQERKYAKQQLEQAMPQLLSQFPQFADLIKSGLISPKDLLAIASKNPSKLQQMVEMLKTPEGKQQLAELSKIGALGGTKVNVDTGGKEYDKELAEAVNKGFDRFMNAGRSAQEKLNDLGQFTRQFSKITPSAYTDKTKQEFLQLASRFGFNLNPDLLSDYASIQSAATQLVISELRQNVGVQTDFDFQVAERYLPSLEKGAANDELLAYQNSVADINKQLANISVSGRTHDYNEDKNLLQKAELLKLNAPAAYVSKRYPNARPVYFTEWFGKYLRKYPDKTRLEAMQDWVRLADADGVR